MCIAFEATSTPAGRAVAFRENLMRVVSMRSGSGYRAQLDRVHRFLDREQSHDPRRDIDYQDDAWAFFQDCWHIKDWLGQDYRALEAGKP
jgi:hypothetical protein